MWYLPYLLFGVTTKKRHTQFQLHQLPDGGGSKAALCPLLYAMQQGCAQLLLDNNRLCVRTSQGMIVQVARGSHAGFSCRRKSRA